MGIRISWEDNNFGESGHRVYRSSNFVIDPSNPPAVYALVADNVTQFDDNSVTEGVTYSYAVSAYFGVNNAVSDQVTITASGDPYIDNVVSLLHFDGVDAETTFIDETDKIWTSNGNAQLSIAEKKFNTASGLFDGVGDYITTPYTTALNLETGDFTIEAFIKTSSDAVDTRSIASHISGAIGWSIDLTSSNTLSFWVNNTQILIGSIPITVSSDWVHIAVCRANGQVGIYVNGVNDGYVNNTDDILPTSALSIGTSSVSNLDFDGYIDEFRLTVGVARYTTDFIPSVEAYPNPPPAGITEAIVFYDPQFTNVTSLLNFDGADGSTTITDATGRVWLVNSNAQLTTAERKYGVSSCLFDTTSFSSITTPSTADFDFGTNDLTIEFFFKRGGTPQEFARLFSSDDGDTYYGIGVIYKTPTELALHMSENGTSNVVDGVEFLTPALSVWYHIAVVVSGGFVKTFVDGVETSSSAFSGSIYYNAVGNFNIGGNSVYISRSINGYIDEFRITKGIARYTGNFTPPTRAFPSFPPSPIDYQNFYEIENISGSTLVDSAGSINGTIVGATVSSSSIGNVLVFDGVDDYVTFGDVLDDVTSVPSAKFSFSFWTNCGAGVSGHILSKTGDSTHTEDQRQYFISAESGVLRFQTFYSLGTPFTYRRVDTSSAVLDGRYHLVLCTYDGSKTSNDGADRFTIYVDGVEQETLFDSVGALGDIQNGTAQLSLGAGIGTNASTISYNLNASIRRVSFYPRVVNASEAKSQYATESLNFGLQAHYTMANINGSTLIDKIGNYNGTMGVDCSITGKGLIDNALLVQAGNISDITDSVTFDTKIIDNTDEYTIACWLKLTSSGQFGIFMQNDSGVNAFGVEFNGYFDTNEIQFTHIRSDTVASNNVCATPQKPDGKWHFYVGTRKGLDIALFEDGVQVSSETLIHNTITNAYNSYIGHYVNGNDNSPYVDCQLDQIRIYDRQLSAVEIEALYHEYLLEIQP